MNEGQAYQYIGGAIVPMHQDGTLMADPGYHDPEATLPGAVSKAVAVEFANVAAQAPAQLQLPAVVAPSRSSAPLTSPGAIIKAAKARATQIRAELRTMKSLQQELAELERLIGAAKQKPVAIVRNIDHSRHAR